MYIDFFFASKQPNLTTKARVILEMVHDSLRNPMSNYIHHNSTRHTRYWENYRHFALILSAIKTKMSIKLKSVCQPGTLR